MRLFGRRPKLPATLRPELEVGERVLAWAPVGSSPGSASGSSSGGDAALIATNRGLWLPGSGRLGWHEIHKVAWSGRELRVIPAEVAEVREDYAVLVDSPPVTFLLLEPGELPDQVRTRVTKSVGYTAHHPLPQGGVRVVGRRVSGVDGLSWAVRYDSGTPVDAEPVINVTRDLVLAAQGATAPPL